MKKWSLIMDFRETLRAHLPPPRPDEPAGLRQDILDELNDHLVCAYHREILRGVDGSVAQRRVLEQFGDPTALACRLWLDAMRGKIMAQRVLIGTCALVVAASLAIVGIFWQQAVVARQMVAREAAEARRREQEMLMKLQEMTEAIKHPRSLDWNPVRMKLTEETATGAPVAGATIVLTRMFENPPKMIQKPTDSSGVADFGAIQPGDYSYQVFRAWKEWTFQHSGALKVQPGSDVTESIVCPKAPPPRAEVRVRWKWPADLQNEALCLYAPFEMRSRELGPGNSWAIARSTVPAGARGIRGQYRVGPGGGIGGGLEWVTPRHFMLCGPSNKLSEFVDMKHPFLWTFGPGGPTRKEDAAEFGSGEWADVLDDDIRQLKDSAATIEMDTGQYALSGLLVLRPSQLRGFRDGLRRFAVLAVTEDSNNIAPRINWAAHPPDRKSLEGLNGNSQSSVQVNSALRLPSEYWLDLSKAFEVRSGQTNEWTIPLPNELIQAVREAIKAEKSPKDKPAAKADASKDNG
jgi:hypothetical protein